MTEIQPAPAPADTDVPDPAAEAEATHPHWKRHVGAFLGGQTVSLFGSMLVQYAVFWYLAIQFQSGVMMTLAAAFGFLPRPSCRCSAASGRTATTGSG